MYHTSHQVKCWYLQLTFPNKLVKHRRLRGPKNGKCSTFSHGWAASLRRPWSGQGSRYFRSGALFHNAMMRLVGFGGLFLLFFLLRFSDLVERSWRLAIPPNLKLFNRLGVFLPSILLFYPHIPLLFRFRMVSASSVYTSVRTVLPHTKSSTFHPHVTRASSAMG